MNVVHHPDDDGPDGTRLQPQDLTGSRPLVQDKHRIAEAGPRFVDSDVVLLRRLTARVQALDK